MSDGEKVVLAAAGNTYNPCLFLLEQAGYEISADEGESSMVWFATKGGFSCQAYSPPELLGMAVLWERLGIGWKVELPDVLGKVLDAVESQDTIGES